MKMRNLVIDKLKCILSVIALVFLFNQSCLGEGSIIEKFVFSNPSYSKHIKTKFYVVTAEVAAELLLLESPPREINSSMYNTAKDKEGYLFIALNNTGNKSPWGSLYFDSPGRKTEVFVPFIYINKWTYYVIPIGRIQNKEDIKRLQKAKLRWKKLYSK